MDERASIGTRLRELRKPTGKSCEQVTREIARRQKVKISREALDKFERDQRTPNAEAVVALADYYECTTDYLLGYSPLKHSVEALETTAFTLGLSLEAAQKLVDVIGDDTSSNNSLFEALMSSPLLSETLSAIRDARGGITRQRRHLKQNAASGDLPPLFIRQCLDMADMYAVRALRVTEPLLREVLGYDELTKEAADGKHTED